MKFSHGTRICLAVVIAACTNHGIGLACAQGGTSNTSTADDKTDGGAQKDANVSEKTVAIHIGDLDLKLPESWKQSDATLPMRLATFEVPAGKGDKENGEFVISSFPGGGGGVDANVSRWVGQFSAEGREAAVRQGKAGKNEYFIVNISGTYMKPVGPPVLRKSKETPGQRMVAVILNLEDKGVYFLKLTGPDATVATQLDAVRASFGGEPDSEKEYEF